MIAALNPAIPRILSSSSRFGQPGSFVNRRYIADALTGADGSSKACMGGDSTYTRAGTRRFPFSLPLAPVEYLELVALVGREQAGDMAQSLGKGGGSQQRVLALPQVVVVEIHCQGKHVYG